MGQKTNPNIFRLGKTQNWTSKYFEKKSTEKALYNFNALEIKKFVNKFFKNNGLTVHICKINYIGENSLYIFVSYYLTLNSVSKINDLNTLQNVRLIKSRTKINRRKYKFLIKNAKNYINYQQLSYNKTLNNFIDKKDYKQVKSIIKAEKKSLKNRRLSFLKYYKRYLNIKKFENIESIKQNTFFEQFFDSLHLFLNSKINIYVTFQQLNKEVKQSLNPKKVKLIKKKLVNLKKYKQNNFFQEGVNILFTLITKSKSANLLAKFIAFQLSNLKRHNFFLKFLKTTLTTFLDNTFSNIQGIKIKVKGRFNGAPRAKHKFIVIGKGVPVLTLNSNIDYAEDTAYTANGTFGIKVWICEKTTNNV